MDKQKVIDEIIFEFGDLFAYNINMNFQTKITEIDFGGYISKNSKPTKKMIFENIVWQEFSEFEFYNIFNSIELDYNFKTFRDKHQIYFEKMKNHISEEQLEKIIESGNMYYSFRQTSGFNCLIITKNELRIKMIS